MPPDDDTPWRIKAFFNELKGSYSTKIFFYLLAAMLLLILIFNFLHIHTQKKRLTNYIVKQGMSIASQFAYNIRVGTFAESRTMHHNAIISVLQKVEVLDVRVLNGNGDEAVTLPKHHRLYIPLKESVFKDMDWSIHIRTMHESGEPMYTEDEEQFFFWSPVMIDSKFPPPQHVYFDADPSEDHFIAGYVAVVLSKADLKRDFRRIIAESLTTCAILFIFSFFLTLFIVRLLSRPLQKLVGVVRESGLKLKSSDEMGILRETYSSQVKTITSAFETIQNLKNELEAVTREVLETQENERKKISRDLHDNVAQVLSSLRITTETLLDGLEDVPEKVQNRKDMISEQVRDCIRMVREMSYDLRPPSLEHLGLVKSLYQYCLDFSDTNNLALDFNAVGVTKLELDYIVKINIFRIVQEALHNVKKHAQAEKVTVKLVGSHPNIIVRIEDNGQGFPVEERLTKSILEKRMGLTGMKERAQVFNGTFEIKSRIDKGTKIRVEIPYTATQSEEE